MTEFTTPQLHTLQASSTAEAPLLFLLELEAGRLQAARCNRPGAEVLSFFPDAPELQEADSGALFVHLESGAVPTGLYGPAEVSEDVHTQFGLMRTQQEQRSFTPEPPRIALGDRGHRPEIPRLVVMLGEGGADCVIANTDQAQVILIDHDDDLDSAPRDQIYILQDGESYVLRCAGTPDVIDATEVETLFAAVRQRED